MHSKSILNLLTVDNHKRQENVRDTVKFAIVSMVNAGVKQFEVAAKFGFSKSTVSKIMKKRKCKQCFIAKKRVRKFNMTEASIRILQIIVVKNNMKLLHVSAAEFREEYGNNLRVKILLRYLYRCEIRNYAAVPRRYLRTRHIVASEQWANMHRGWDMHEWGKVAFRDDSTFAFKSGTLRKRVWRKPGERYRTVNMVAAFKSDYKPTSAWDVFSVYGCTTLVHIEGNLDQQKYVSMLQDSMFPFTEACHGRTEFITFMQDRCGPHRAKSVCSFLQANGVEFTPWTMQSTYIKLIENTWSILKRIYVNNKRILNQKKALL